MSYPKQEERCNPCSGYGRVAVIMRGPRLFEAIIGQPLPCTFAEARQKLQAYQGSDAGMLSVLVRGLANNLDTVMCPWCSGSGIAWSIQQLTDEEAAAYRAES